jgi:hypothetical protein
MDSPIAGVTPYVHNASRPSRTPSTNTGSRRLRGRSNLGGAANVARSSSAELTQLLTV